MLKTLQKYKLQLVYVPLGLYWLVLLTLTSLPGPDLPDVNISDKIEHLLAFWVLAILLKLTLWVQNKYRKLKEHSSVFTLIIIGVYAALDEIHQLFIPGRDCDILDWFSDMSGALIAVLIISFVIKYLSKKKEPGS